MPWRMINDVRDQGFNGATTVVVEGVDAVASIQSARCQASMGPRLLIVEGSPGRIRATCVPRASMGPRLLIVEGDPDGCLERHRVIELQWGHDC